MDEESLQEMLADEGTFKGETDESELEALVSKLKTNILILLVLMNYKKTIGFLYQMF